MAHSSDDNVKKIPVIEERVDIALNCIVTLDERLKELRNDISQRLDAFEKFVMTRFDAVDRKFAAMDRKFDAVNQRLDAMDQRFDRVDTRLDRMDRRFDTLEGLLRELVGRPA